MSGSALDPRAPAAVGDGRFVLHELIGEGGMARVYRGLDLRLGVVRAIKLMKFDDDRADEGWRRRFQREARAMAQLRHPNIVQVFDTGREGDVDYLVMEMMEGGSLHHLLADHGPLSPDAATAIMAQVLDGLAVVHQAGIVHRDVKPDNVLLDSFGNPHLADFGIAMVTDATLRGTRPGMGMGSLAYMPPEQRQDASSVTPKADIYASGTTLYRCLTEAPVVDLFLAGSTSPRWRGMPAPLVRVLRQACHEDPEQRFASARDFANALRALGSLGNTPLPMPPAATPLESRPATISSRAAQTGSPPLLHGTSWMAIVSGFSLGVLIAGVLAASFWVLPEDVDAPVEPAPTVPQPAPAPKRPHVEPETMTPPSPVSAPPIRTPSPNLRPTEAPVPIATPNPSPSTPAAGTWRMNNNGVRVELELQGPADAIRGVARSRLGATEAAVDVSGTFDPSTRRLLLDELEGGVSYDLILEPGLGRGMGFVDQSGVRRRVTIDRAR